MGALRRRGRALAGLWREARRRYAWLDHAARARGRYADRHADRLAAALAYYAFFAVFALTGVGFAALGWLLRRDAAATRAAQQWVDLNLPGLDVAALAEVSTRIGVIALAALLIAGLAWVKGLRSAVRTVWGLPERPGSLHVRLGLDVAVLAALGVLLLVSVGIAVGVAATVRWLVLDAAGIDIGPTRLLISALGFLLGLAVNTVLAMAVLSALPRIRIPLRRVIGPALLVAVGLELLKTLGRLFLERSMANPAYQAVTGAVGLLLFLYVLNQVVLYAAALTATSRHGTATDLGGGTPRSGRGTASGEGATGGSARSAAPDAGTVIGAGPGTPPRPVVAVPRRGRTA